MGEIAADTVAPDLFLCEADGPVAVERKDPFVGEIGRGDVAVPPPFAVGLPRFDDDIEFFRAEIFQHSILPLPLPGGAGSALSARSGTRIAS